jgi:hypothetical protein
MASFGFAAEQGLLVDGTEGLAVFDEALRGYCVLAVAVSPQWDHGESLRFLIFQLL